MTTSTDTAKASDVPGRTQGVVEMAEGRGVEFYDSQEERTGRRNTPGVCRSYMSKTVKALKTETPGFPQASFTFYTYTIMFTITVTF